MLDNLTFDQMEPHVGSKFRVDVGGKSIDLILTRAGKVMESEAARLKRAAFSLFFSGPGEPFLPQQIYQFHHAAFGDEGLGIFLVPVAKQADGFLYEAVFT